MIFLFLRNISATVIPSLALPGSMVATFTVMYLLGYSLDNLSLMALTLSVGFVVDDAIVMLENIVRHMEMGKSPMQAALDGSKEIAFTILSMTVSLAAVFIPVLFMGGIVGRLLHEFAVTIGVAILVSGFVSISLTPMLCSRFLKPPHERRARAAVQCDRARVRRLARASTTARCGCALRIGAATMAISIALLAGTVVLFSVVPKGFLPSEDQGRFVVNTEAHAGDQLRRHGAASARRSTTSCWPIRTCRLSAANVGSGGSGRRSTPAACSSSSSRERSGVSRSIRSSPSLRPKLAQIPGLRVFMTNPPPINLGGQQGARSLYQFTLQDTDTTELYQWAPMLEDKIRQMPGFEDVSSDLQLNNPQVSVEMDRDKVATLGLTVNQVETALYNAYGTRQVSQIYAPNNQYQVILQVAPEFQRDPYAHVAAVRAIERAAGWFRSNRSPASRPTPGRSR